MGYVREIKPELVTFIDAKLASNGLAEHAFQTGDARLVFQMAAQTLVGVREVGGNNQGPMVQLIQETIGGHGAESWCMAFVQSCIAYTELKTNVRSLLFPTEHCLTAWRETPKAQRVKYFPLPGAIIIWQHGKSENGHTGIMLEADHISKQMRAIEGNTESGLNSLNKVVRDGGGVYLTKRDMKANGDMNVVGFMKPF